MGLLVLIEGCNLIFGLEERQPYPPGSACFDGAKNGDETSRDCGGGECVPCKDGDGCEVGPDCESLVCIGGTCIAPGCTDQVANGEEIDVDCGGPCPKCGPDQACTGDQDCKSNACTNGFCRSTCTDTAKGGDETGVDCGGSECPVCPNGEGCAVGPDCESGVCKVEFCVDYHVWSKSFGANNFLPPRIAVDASGNATLASGVEGTVDFGGGPLVGGNDFDIGIAGFDASGSHVWSKRFGDSAYQTPYNVAVTDSGSIVTTGHFFGTVFFDSSLTSAGQDDIFVARLSASGAPLASSRFGDAQIQRGHDVTLDSLENICLIGSHEGTVNFGGDLLSSAGGFDVFIAKLDSLGTHLWSKRFGDAQSQYAGTGSVREAIAVDGVDNVLAAGSFNGGINFGGGLLTNAGGKDMFIVKLDSAGNHLWSKRFGDDQPQSGIEATIAADGSGNILVSGSFKGTVDFGAGPLTTAGTDIYVAKLDALGNHLWSKRFGDGMPQAPQAPLFRCDVAVDGVGNVLLVGDFAGTIDFGGGPLISAGSRDIFVAKFDQLGKHLWSKRFGDDQSQGAFSVAPYDSENVLIAGSLRGSVDFGGGPLVNTGGEELFLAKLRLP